MNTKITIGHELLAKILSGQDIVFENGNSNIYSISLDKMSWEEYMKAITEGMRRYSVNLQDSRI